ncbi:phosphatidylglycerophosphate synthase [Paenarthrobacter nicotinovorans]|uniref:DUF3180 domain-containing protein n=1 Tax=Paenarthrobacter nicotinovorans TaxID=29320 RepID=A0ABV0GQH4_PAENI|nr:MULTISPECIES: DUF3180 domain-containing protein [Micrococcaceae]MDR6438164.1 phosphatidylglycerophosphate synthase [Paenarthrobacter nicotinovorans]BCW56830.1 hypothetical protein StoSoilB20_01770 [Arthrobacter sp. StoSoilB20]SCZ52383.1 Protein of unknown function [Arthrobacter sp. UNCCL28]
MKAMRPVVLVLIAVVAVVVGWLATATTNRYSMPTPVLPVSALVTMAVIAGLTLIMGIRVLRWRNGKKKNMLNPILAARTLVLAQACAYAGTLLFGWHAGISMDLLRIGSLRGGEGILWNALLMGGGGVVMVVVGLVVERFCRIPPEDLEGGSAGPGTRRGETKGEGEYAYRGD